MKGGLQVYWPVAPWNATEENTSSTSLSSSSSSSSSLSFSSQELQPFNFGLRYHFSSMGLSTSHPTHNPGGPSHNFGLCSPRELVKRLRNPLYTPLVGHTLSGSSAVICLVWVTLAVAYLSSILPPA